MDETREAGGQSLWASVWSGKACPPLVHQWLPTGRAKRAGCSRSDHSHIHGSWGFLFAVLFNVQKTFGSSIDTWLSASDEILAFGELTLPVPCVASRKIQKATTQEVALEQDLLV